MTLVAMLQPRVDDVILGGGHGTGAVHDSLHDDTDNASWRGDRS